MATAVRMRNTTSDSPTAELSRTIVPCAFTALKKRVYASSKHDVNMR